MGHRLYRFPCVLLEKTNPGKPVSARLHHDLAHFPQQDLLLGGPDQQFIALADGSESAVDSAEVGWIRRNHFRAQAGSFLSGKHQGDAWPAPSQSMYRL